MHTSGAQQSPQQGRPYGDGRSMRRQAEAAAAEAEAARLAAEAAEAARREEAAAAREAARVQGLQEAEDARQEVRASLHPCLCAAPGPVGAGADQVPGHLRRNACRKVVQPSLVPCASVSQAAPHSHVPGGSMHSTQAAGPLPWDQAASMP